MSSDPTDPLTADPITADPITADQVADAVRQVPGVHGLHGGAFGEVATYLPGRRVSGVRLTGSGCEVHVVLAWDRPVLSTAQALRTRLEALVPGPVTVVVEDIAPPSPPLHEQEAP